MDGDDLCLFGMIAAMGAFGYVFGHILEAYFLRHGPVEGLVGLAFGIVVMYVVYRVGHWGGGVWMNRKLEGDS